MHDEQDSERKIKNTALETGNRKCIIEECWTRKCSIKNATKRALEEMFISSRGRKITKRFARERRLRRLENE